MGVCIILHNLIPISKFGARQLYLRKPTKRTKYTKNQLKFITCKLHINGHFLNVFWGSRLSVILTSVECFNDNK